MRRGGLFAFADCRVLFPPCWCDFISRVAPMLALGPSPSCAHRFPSWSPRERGKQTPPATYGYLVHVERQLWMQHQIHHREERHPYACVWLERLLTCLSPLGKRLNNLCIAMLCLESCPFKSIQNRWKVSPFCPDSYLASALPGDGMTQNPGREEHGLLIKPSNLFETTA